MTILALYVLLSNNPVDLFFPGYEPLPGPKAEDLQIVPLDNPTPAHCIVKQEPILRA